jgi:hypothetical protein
MGLLIHNPIIMHDKLGVLELGKLLLSLLGVGVEN